MTDFTASSLPRAFRCLASILYQQAQYRTAYGEAGNERHDKREAAVLAGDYSEFPSEVAERLEGYNNVTPELAMAYDVATDKARILGRGIKRAYVVTPTEIAGTGDVVAIQMEGDRAVRGMVLDWKGHEDVEGPADNKQTLHNALCVARIYGLREITVCISNEGRAPVFADLDVFDLDAFAAALRRLNKAAEAARPRAAEFENEGDHCKHCNAFRSCTKKQAMVVEMGNGDMSRRLDVLLPLENDEQATRAYQLAGKLRQMLKRLDAAIHTRGAERPIPTGDGMLFGRIAKQGNEELDPDKTYELVRELYGQAAADKAVKREAAKSWLEAALRAAGAKPLTKAKEEVLAELKKRGGISRKQTEGWDVFPALLPKPE